MTFCESSAHNGLHGNILIIVKKEYNMEQLQVNRKTIEKWISEGYDIIQDGKLIKIEGDLKEFIDQFEAETENKPYLLKELVTWPDEELEKL